MKTYNITVLASGLTGVLALAAAYDGAVAADPDNGAAGFILTDANEATLLDSGGGEYKVNLGLQDGSEGNQAGDGEEMTTFRSRLDQVTSLQGEIESNTATDMVSGAEIQSGDGQTAWILTLSIPGQESGPAI